MVKTYMSPCSRIICVLLLLAASITQFKVYAQNNSVTIGGTEIKQDAVLYLIADGNQGLILPAVTNIASFTPSTDGMVVFNQADNTVYFYNGTQWVGVGSGSGSSNAYSLRLQGNNLELLLNGSVQDQIALSDFTAGGDLTGNIQSATVVALNGEPLPGGTPGTNQILVYNGAAWVYQNLPTGTFSGVATDATLTGTGLSGDPLSVVSVDDADADPTNEIQNLSNVLAEGNSAGNIKITNLADPTVNQDAATKNYVDTQIGVISVPSDFSGAGTSGLVPDPGTESGSFLRDDGTWTTPGGGGDLLSTNNLSELTDVTAARTNLGLGTLATLNSITSSEITDGTVTGADISTSADIVANSFTGDGSGLTGISATVNTDGSTISGDGSVGTPLVVPANGITTNEIANGTITNIDISTTAAIDVAKISGLLDNDASNEIQDIANVLGVSNDAGGLTIVNVADPTNPQDVATKNYVDTNGGVTNLSGLSDASVTSPSNGQILIYNNTNTQFENKSLSGDILIDETGLTAIQDAAVQPNDIEGNGGTRAILGSGNAGNVTWVSTTGPHEILGTDGAGDLAFRSSVLSTGGGGSGIRASASATDDVYPTEAAVREALDAMSGFNTLNEVPRGDGSGLVSSNIFSDGTNVGIGGAASPVARLNLSSADMERAVTIVNSRSSNGTNYGVRSDVSGNSDTNYGIYSNAFSGTTAYGMFSSAGSASTAYGVAGQVAGTGITTAYGISGAASSTSATTNYGVYGSASGGINNWAGYFAGNLAVNGELAVGATPNAGTTGQILTSQGAGAAPVWADNTGGGWGLTGNSGTTAGTNFLGTTDAQPLEVKVDNTRVARFEYDGATAEPSPNIIAGHPSNAIGAGLAGVTISGGGYTNANIGNGDWASIGGGRDNQAGAASNGRYSTIAGGASNRSTFQFSSVGGGRSNNASGRGATIPGGLFLNASSFGMTAVGTANETTSFTANSWVPTEPIFVVGNGEVNASNAVLSNSNALTILKNGNVGIGTSSPNSLLEVTDGVLHMSDLLDDNNAFIRLTSTTDWQIGPESAGTGGRFLIGNFGNMLFSSIAIEESPGFGTPGNVGIGIVGASNMLDVNGGMAVGTSYVGIETAPSDGAIIQGNVGIGTPTPAAKLDIEGTGVVNTRVASNDGSTLNMDIFRTGASNTDYRIKSDDVDDRLKIQSSTDDGTNYNDVLSVDASNVRINGEVHTASTGANNMLPIAYGYINGSTGAVVTSTGNVSAVRTGTGAYQVTISGESVTVGSYIIQATRITSSSGQIAVTSVSGNILVYTYNSSGTAIDTNFQFVLYKP